MKRPSFLVRLLSLSLLSGVLTSACGKKDEKAPSSQPPSDIAPKRVLLSGSPEVVVITYNGALRCTGTILDHGVVLTARHCFDNGLEKNIENIEIKVESYLSNPELTITKLSSLSFDSGANDFAWITYEKEQSLGRKDLQKIELDRDHIPTEGDPLSLIGFPVTDSGKLLKLVTRPCIRLKRQGEILPLPKDPGYLGTFYDTNCIAWRGNSGGPLFSMKTGTSGLEIHKLVGIVTHTFDVSASGSILETALSKDEFGTYVKTVNFSSLTAAKDVDLYLK
ncbi:MAG: serine protease [Pseudomonadota bacterium]